MEKQITIIYGIVIICLVAWCAVLSQGNKQAQNMGLNNLTLIQTNLEQISKLTESDTATTVILTRLAEDYPPKNPPLKDRKWCLNYSCLPVTYR